MKERFSALASRFKSPRKGSSDFRLRKSLVGVIALYMAAMLLINAGIILAVYAGMRSFNHRQHVEAASRQVSQAALSINEQLQAVDAVASFLYEECSIQSLQVQPLLSFAEGDFFNILIQQIFGANPNITGITLYRSNGGMLSYRNPHSPYQFFSGEASLYDRLLKYREKESILLRNEADKQEQSMLAVRYFDSPSEFFAIALEVNWGSQRELLSGLGLLEDGSVIMTNERGKILMAFRSSQAMGDVDIVRNGKLTGKLQGEAGMVPIQEYGEEKVVFFNGDLEHDCTLLYILDEAFLYVGQGDLTQLLMSCFLCLLLMNGLIFLLFYRNIYRPIVNIEDTLDAIVSGETDLTLHDTPANSSLVPLYGNLNLLIYRLKKLIDSEYAASVREKQAEIDALQSQINPHFLYNTLECIRGQALEEGMDSIAKMVKSLADIFRFSITNKNEMVTLSEELRNIDNYLNIQQFRFGDRFVVNKEIAPDVMQCRVPKLIVQPLVENAIIHGMETKEGQGTICITAKAMGEDLIISVEDNGEGIDIETLAYITDCLAKGVPVKDRRGVRTGLALVNINERLKMIFGQPYGLTIYSMKHMGTNAQLRIPKTVK